MEQSSNRINWRSLTILFTCCIIISFGLGYLFNAIWRDYELSLGDYAWVVYLSVLGITLLCNLTIIAPVPIGATIVVAAATNWNPVMIALAASIGGTIGELSGYYAGYLGRKVAIAESMIGYNKILGWMERYSAWAIFFLAFQPVLPFDIGGIIAGASKMPLHKFMLALWAGKFPKYIILCYTGVEIADILPFWPD